MKAFVISALAWVSLAIPSALAATPELTDLSLTREGEDYLISCRLTGALSPQVLEEIEAGLETTFVYRVQVHRRRIGLPNPVVVKRRVQCTVKLDALTRQYTLTRRIDDELDETRSTSDPALMRTFMTSLDRVPVVQEEELQTDEEHYIKIKSDLGLRWRFFLIPLRLDTAWVRVPIERPGGNGRETQP